MNSDIRRSVNINCEDEYEAEKLMWILSSDRKQHTLKHVDKVDEKELILVLNDESSHSIMLADKASVEMLQKTADMILEKGNKRLSIQVHRNIVKMEFG